MIPAALFNVIGETLFVIDLGQSVPVAVLYYDSTSLPQYTGALRYPPIPCPYPLRYVSAVDPLDRHWGRIHRDMHRPDSQWVSLKSYDPRIATSPQVERIRA